MPKHELNWSKWLKDNGASDDLVRISPELGESPWSPSGKDREAAWILYTEIRTRISTQPLHYRSGDEETALDSLYKLFALTRNTIKDKGPECWHFATIATQILNTHIRPLTAKWHKKKIDGRLLHDDDRREFRKELSEVQKRLIEFCRLLGSMAGDEYLDSDACKPVSETDKEEIPISLGSDIPFDSINFNEDEVSNSDEIHLVEFKAIYLRRHGKEYEDVPGVEKPTVMNLAGLACSGGGIRSATFCLGVAQSLSCRGLLKDIDYLSTVSGGGYFGSFLSSYLNDANGNVGLEPGKLPFAETGQAEPEPIRKLRNASKYLLKGGLVGQSRMVGVLLLGILINLLTLLSILLGAVAITKLIGSMGVSYGDFRNLVEEILKALVVVFAFLLFLHPIIYRNQEPQGKITKIYERSGIYIVWAFGILSIFGWALPALYLHIEDGVSPSSVMMSLYVVLTLLITAFVLTKEITSIVKRIVIILLSVSGPLLLMMGYLNLVNNIPTNGTTVFYLFAGIIPLIVWLWFVNVNQVSPHRYYRNRLAETYLVRRGHTQTIDPQPLSELQKNNLRAPYHLINAAVNLPASRNPELRGRDSDFFLFGKHYCGSPLLGYCRTVELQKKDSNLDLGTVMAVSGAAASSYMGTNTIKWLSFWMSLLNLRLGYWLPNPKKLGNMPFNRGAHPFLLWSELFGRIDENRKFVNLSDGGHIENLGIYELLRRRCKFIIAIDGEADPEMKFPSLMQLIRYARIDFGIDIQLDLNDLKPNAAGVTKAHFTLGVIDYGNELKGYLLYIKSSLTGNERDYIRDYKQDHKDFPHETTAYQFFSEAQFEAYRALGEHIGNDLFHSELIKGAGGNDLKSWFGALLRNLQTTP